MSIELLKFSPSIAAMDAISKVRLDKLNTILDKEEADLIKRRQDKTRQDINNALAWMDDAELFASKASKNTTKDFELYN
jgi:hypothetical protein